MRIIAGTLRGRTLESPSEKTTRPTTDRVRESMFSSIYSRLDIEGVSVLDAFAGSGALGVEALSRGAGRVTFFEADGDAHKVLKRNLEKLKIGRGQATLVHADVFTAAERRLPGSPFDLVLLDPPYAYPAADVLDLMLNLQNSGSLKPDALIVYEYSNKNAREVTALFEACDELQVSTQKKYGHIGVIYLRPGVKEDTVPSAEQE